MTWEGLPTVELRVEVPLPQEGGGWGWHVDGRVSPAGREPAYSRHDLLRVMLTYGVMVATLFASAGPSAFRVTAWEIHTRRTVGAYSFRWDGDRGRYMPEGDPFIIWDKYSDRIAAGLKGGHIQPAAVADEPSHTRVRDEPQEARQRPQVEPGRQRQPQAPRVERERAQERTRQRYSEPNDIPSGDEPRAHCR